MTIDRISQTVNLAATRAAQSVDPTPATRPASTTKDSVDLRSGSVGAGGPEGSLWSVMLDYQKMVNKEAREDSKLEHEKDKIDRMKEDAGRRFDTAMSAASAGMILGFAGAASVVDTAAEKKSDAIQRRISEQEQATHRATVDAEDSRDSADAGRDRRRSTIDSIKRFLDLIRGMNPQI